MASKAKLIGNYYEKRVREDEFLCLLYIANVFPSPHLQKMEDYKQVSVNEYKVKTLVAGQSLFTIPGGKSIYRNARNRFFQQMRSALETLHHIGIHHLDLNFRNIAWDENTRNFVLIDFGEAEMSRDWNVDEDLEVLRDRMERWLQIKSY